MIQEDFEFDEFGPRTKEPESFISRTLSGKELKDKEEYDEYIRRKAAEIREKTESARLSRPKSQIMSPEHIRNLKKRQRMLSRPLVRTGPLEAGEFSGERKGGEFKSRSISTIPKLSPVPKEPKLYVLPEKKKAEPISRQKSSTTSRPKKSRAKIQMPKMTYISRAKPQAITPSPIV